MQVVVEQHAPQVRCYECGSPKIAALCHHCWRPGCHRHVTAAPRWAEKLLGREASGPGLERAHARHCAECGQAAVGYGIPLASAGAALAVVGVIAIWLIPIAAVALVAAGGALAALACLDVRRQAAKARATRPLPTHPKVDSLSVLEKLRPRIRLGPEGGYVMEPCPVEGTFTTVLVFGRADRDRLVRHLRGRPGPAAGHDVLLTAGRLVFRGRADAREVPDLPGPVLSLERSTCNLPVFREEDPHASSSWTISGSYLLPADRDLSPGPIWITPSLVPDSDQRALELDVQWNETGPDEPLSIDRIDLLELRFPVSWGEAEQSSRRATLAILPEDHAGQVLRAVRWRHLLPTKEEHLARRLTLITQFEEQIGRGDVVSGRLEVTMNGTLSGIDGVRLYDALGRGRNLPGVSIRTRIEVDFELSLASICYQRSRIMPGHRTENGDDSNAGEFSVIPDHETVIDLTNTLSEHGYYIKHVIENPPRSGGRADHVQRVWDVAGRRYQGIYPIDFHMILTGQEVHRGDIRPEHGTTKTQIVVHGAYTDDEMNSRIEEEWKTLRRVTTDALARLASTPRPPSIHGGAAGAGQEATLAAAHEQDSPSDALASSRWLRRVGKLLDEALLDKVITPAQYTEIQARAEQEFGGG